MQGCVGGREGAAHWKLESFLCSIIKIAEQELTTSLLSQVDVLDKVGQVQQRLSYTLILPAHGILRDWINREV